MTTREKTLHELTRFDTPTVCNAIELFDVVPRNRGYMDGRVKCNFPEFPPIVGYASTAAFRADAPPQAGDAYGSIQSQVETFTELPGPPIVVFQDLDDPPIAAVFGEVMCSTYQAFGAAGLITNGAGRDVQQVRDLGFPIFTGSTICSHGYCHILHVGLPVRVGGLTVNHGDLLHADANGVTRIPLEIVDELPQVCDEFVAAEQLMLEYTKATGPKELAEFSRRRLAFQEEIRKLQSRVSRRTSNRA